MSDEKITLRTLKSSLLAAFACGALLVAAGCSATTDHQRGERTGDNGYGSNGGTTVVTPGGWGDWSTGPVKGGDCGDSCGCGCQCVCHSDEDQGGGGTSDGSTSGGDSSGDYSNDTSSGSGGDDGYGDDGWWGGDDGSGDDGSGDDGSGSGDF